ncbi:uncharacterized protein LOC135832098 isoform X2 [Planococcus citri]|uniref:uncharacterized protein LOC135832098 isoform X2 n=1 Tax=Planococcus citri TaxID=170843 RepID=UPI0031F804C2
MRSRNSNMVQSYLDDTTLRLMGMLMTISLGIFTILFLYVLYNMTVNVAGTTIAMLFFISLAFFIVLMKTFKLLGKFISHSQQISEHESQSGIPTISEIISHPRARHDSAPPPYEEAIKNFNSPIQTQSNTPDVPFTTTLSSPVPHQQNTVVNYSRCTVSMQIPAE